MDIRMMRLTRAQFAALKLLITGLIAADLFAFWVWATRPPHIYSAWLGLDDRSESPFTRIDNWAHWNAGPRTPSGFVVLFDASELVFGGVLLLALVLLVVFLFAPRQADTPMSRRLSAKLGTLQFRMSIALAPIAIVGGYLGWEVHSWRTWRKRLDFKVWFDQASVAVESNLSTLQARRNEGPDDRDRVRSHDWGRGALPRSRAPAPSGVTDKDLKKQEVDVLLAKLVSSTERKLKYRQAADNPLRPLAPDRPAPQNEKEAGDWLGFGDYGRALAVYDELASTYPDLVEAHSRSAWIRATCPDAHFRDGKLAIESARRRLRADWLAKSERIGSPGCGHALPRPATLNRP